MEGDDRMAEQYDLSIIGAGPGGYVAALYAAQRGLKVCLFEKGDIGGVCLNEGCIPTKTMHRSASVLEEVTRAAQYGIRTQDPVIDMELVKSRVDKTVTLLRSGVEQLLKARKVTVKKGVARIAGQAG
jgi:dihydrolipoamide dehydrogenase